MENLPKPESSKEVISVKTINKNKNEGNTSQITIGEFLNFLKTAYQVQDSVEGVLMAGGMTEAVNWLKLKEIELRQKSICCQTSETLVTNQMKGAGDDKRETTTQKSTTTSLETELLKRKFNEVLSEGILDSVLPYLVQNVQSAPVIHKRPTIIKLQDKNSTNAITSSNDKIMRRKSSEIKPPLTKTESEVEIHVCDEVKNTKKTFVCNQKLLVEKMGYFAEVTLGQRLEDMDISVHCDIGIFEWLMQWVKKDSLLESDWPQLDPQCVVPILVSAAFLQMEPLLHDCLLYCHEHMNEVLRTTSSLSCLNDSVLTRLAAMYTNAEVEAIKDRKDKIQSKLFAKLIQSLGEVEPESVRGHWCSLARVFKCSKCEQFFTPNVALKIPCIPSFMRLQPDGSIISMHLRDASWNINEHILKLQKKLKTWRKVYWHLWGDSHFLYCLSCKRYFPVNQIGWCRFHPDSPQFFTLDAQKAPLPIGRFPCCGERAYRFQLLENYSGCQFRQHTVCPEDVKESAIYTMLETYRHLIEEEPPQLLFPERLTRLVARDPNVNDKKFVCKETFWWDGFEIIPPRPKLSLLSGFANRNSKNYSNNLELSFSESTTSTETDEESDTSSSSDSSEGSAESNPPPKKNVAKNKLKKQNEARLWQHNLSARSNQDIQRAYEENALKEMAEILSKRTICDIRSCTKSTARASTPLGGIWVKLEADWKESLNQNAVAPAGQQKLKNMLVAKFAKPKGKF